MKQAREREVECRQIRAGAGFDTNLGQAERESKNKKRRLTQPSFLLAISKIKLTKSIFKIIP